MDAYLIPIKTALLTFPILAFFMTIPFIIYQYRKYKYINKFRVFITYSFWLYMLTAYYLVILPLPQTRDTLSLYPSGTSFYQLTPFNFIGDIIKETNVIISKPSTYINLLTERAFLQAAFNAMMLLPLGIYLRYYFRKNLKKTILITFLVSLFFEITQITGLYGMYNSPYRLFDVDDLILNTLSGVIGYAIAPIFIYFLPKSDKLDEGIDFKKMQVGFIRRSIALFIDWLIIGTVIEIITFIFPFEKNIIIEGGAIFIYFIVLLYHTNGKTIGKRILKIKIKGKGEHLTLKEVIVRYGILYYGVVGVNIIISRGLILSTDGIDHMVLSLVLLMINFIIGVHVFLHIFKRDKRLFYEKISGTRNVID